MNEWESIKKFKPEDESLVLVACYSSLCEDDDFVYTVARYYDGDGFRSEESDEHISNTVYWMYIPYIESKKEIEIKQRDIIGLQQTEIKSLRETVGYQGNMLTEIIKKYNITAEELAVISNKCLGVNS